MKFATPALTLSLLFASSTFASEVGQTRHFEFHSNFWVNLHHYLFKTAEEAEEKGLEEAVESFWPGLNASQEKILRPPVEHYRENWIDKSLLFDDGLYWFKRELVKLAEAPGLGSRVENAHLARALDTAAPVYRETLWPRHDRENRDRLKANIALIRKFEKPAFDRLQQLAGSTLREERIHVDLTFLANWAGAYTTVKPRTHVTIATGEEDGPRGDWIELLFHEATHALIGPRRGRVAEVIGEVSKAAGRKPPRNLWHGILFYTAGRVVQDLLAEKGIDYELYMFRWGVFDAYHSALKQHYEPYIAGRASLKEAVRSLFEAVK